MSINQIGGGAAFFGMGFFQGATAQIQQAPMQQIQQLQAMLQSSFQNFFQAANQFSSNMGAGFAQSPAASPGFVQPPSTNMMNPVNPGSIGGQFGGQFGGGFVAGGFIAGGQIGGQFGGQFGGQIGGGFGQTGGEIGAPNSGLIQTSKNPPEYTTPGGYKVAAEGKDMAWTVTTPEGKKTRIWGDPHVHESDGGKWDFKKDMSFVLPDGTKITAKTVPWGNDATVTGSIDIMNGNQRASIGGIDKNKDLTDSGVQNDRWAVDARTPDGDYAVLGGSGADWFLNGKNEITGGNMKTGELYTKQGAGNNNITAQAAQAMSEPGQLGLGGFPQMPGQVGLPGQGGMQQPQFGGQQFLLQMLQQMMQSIFSQMQQMRPF